MMPDAADDFLAWTRIPGMRRGLGMIFQGRSATPLPCLPRTPAHPGKVLNFRVGRAAVCCEEPLRFLPSGQRDSIFPRGEFAYFIRMDRLSRIAAFPFLIAAVLMLVASGCGNDEKEIPKEERGEPNVLPEEIVLYREARDVFREWTQVFDAQRSFQSAFGLLSRASRSRLREEGVSDAAGFERWFMERANAGMPPFSYTFSRFDIIDIEMRDSSEALLTGTFIVQVHSSTFESVGTFRLRRQGGRWVVPFAESGDFESSWWQKERQFSTRVREEGTSTYTAQKLGLSVRYPITWDVSTRSTLGIPGHGSAGAGIELTYIDPTTLLPQAIMRIATLPVAVPDSVLAVSGNGGSTDPVVLRRENATVTEGGTLSGKLMILADVVNNRQIAVLAVVDENSSFQFFGQTFESILSSIATSKVTPQ